MYHPLRVEIPDGWSPVLIQGLRRHATLTDDDDHTIFLKTLGETCQRSGLNIF